MNQQIKSLLIVTPICIVSAGLTVALCFIDSAFVRDKIITVILLSVWAFFLVPSVLYAIGWARLHLNHADPLQSFRIGWIWGDLIFLGLIAVAPVSGLLWYIQTIKAVALSLKREKQKNSEIGKDDIFNL